MSVIVRDSKLGDDGPLLEFSRDEWEAFLTGVGQGEFALPELRPVVERRH